METNQQLITLITGALNPLIIEFAINGYYFFQRNRILTDEDKHFIETAIAWIINLLGAGIVLLLLASNGYIANSIEGALMVVQFILTSQGSYDVGYKRVLN